MQDILIEKAAIENLKDVQELNYKLFLLEDEHFDPDLNMNWIFGEVGTEYFTNMINNQIVYVAKQKDKVVGYLAGNTKAENSYLSIKVAEIDNMYVEEEYRRFGIGSMLIDRFKEYCKQLGINTFKVNASYGNKTAIEFYKSKGFLEHDITLWCRQN